MGAASSQKTKQTHVGRLPQLALGRRRPMPKRRRYLLRPWQWVMLDEASKDDDTRLFVNVLTARRRLSLLYVHAQVGFSDCLLVLGDRPYWHHERLIWVRGEVRRGISSLSPYHRVLVGAYGLWYLCCVDPASERF